MSSKEQDFTVRGLLQNQPLCLFRLALEHSLLKDYYFGAILKNALERFVRSSSFHDHSDVRVVFKQPPKPLPQ
jgi:hypothetical protein